MKTNDKSQIRADNLNALIKSMFDGNRSKFSRTLESRGAKMSLVQIGQWIDGTRNMSESSAQKIEAALSLQDGALSVADASSMLVQPNQAWGRPVHVALDNDQSLRIPYMSAYGACGDGAVNEDVQTKGYLIKEPSWFEKYGVTNDQLATIYAVGDSMADFIVNGDMVIFNITKTTPIDGEIFAIEHPSGTKIKKLRQNFDGSWTLISNNPDKRKHPDEDITEEKAEQMIIRGQFVYRQGG